MKHQHSYSLMNLLPIITLDSAVTHKMAHGSFWLLPLHLRDEGMWHGKSSVYRFLYKREIKSTSFVRNAYIIKHLKMTVSRNTIHTCISMFCCCELPYHNLDVFKYVQCMHFFKHVILMQFIKPAKGNLQYRQLFLLLYVHSCLGTLSYQVNVFLTYVWYRF